MRKVFILLFFFAATTIFAQTNKISVGASVMPLWSDFLITDRGSENDALLANARETFIGVPGINAHIFAESQFNQRLALRIGLGYSQTGIRDAKQSGLTWPSPGPSNPDALQNELVCKDVSVPVMLKLHPKKSTRYYGLVGLASWLSLSRTQKRTFWYPDGRKETSKSTPSESYKKFNSNATLGFGYDVRLYSKIHLFFEPTVTCNVWSITDDTIFRFRTFTVGLNTGIRF
jgi:hypothetical protein